MSRNKVFNAIESKLSRMARNRRWSEEDQSSIRTALAWIKRGRKRLDKRNEKPAPLERAEFDKLQMMETLEEQSPAGWGIVLLLCSYGEEGKSTYISTCDRADVVKLFREMADKIESGKEI